VLSSPLLSAVSFDLVALPLVCVAGQLGAPRRNRDLLTEEVDLIFPIDPERPNNFFTVSKADLLKLDLQ
jgi:hypothetical protein